MLVPSDSSRIEVMLVEGTCANGHELVCTVREGRLRGTVVRGALRVTCPRCGAEILVAIDDASVLTLGAPSSRREAG
jgi:hypothetical protein